MERRKDMRREIYCIEDLADVINDVVNYVVAESCRKTTTGNYIMEADDVSHIISKEDYLTYFYLIAAELASREEVLDLDTSYNMLDAIYGLNWCPNYEILPEEEGIPGFEADEHGNLLHTQAPDMHASLTERAAKYDVLRTAMPHYIKTLEGRIERAKEKTCFDKHESVEHDYYR